MDDGLVVTKIPGRLAHYLCLQSGTKIVALARFQSEDAVNMFMEYLRKGAGKPFRVVDEDLLEDGAVFTDPVLTNAAIQQNPLADLFAGWKTEGSPKHYGNRGG